MAVDIPSRLTLPEDMDRGGRRLIRVVVRGFMRLIYRVRYVNFERFPTEGPVILITNHRSLMDIPAVHVHVKPWVYFVAKQELYEGGFGRRFLSWWGAIPINRERIQLSTVRDILGLLKRRRILSIFPEGTRVPRDAAITDYPAHPGVILFARRSGAQILPFGIRGRFGLGRRIALMVGDPFTPDELVAADGTPLDDDAAAHAAMARVYTLIGEDYPPYEDFVRAQATPDGEAAS